MGSKKLIITFAGAVGSSKTPIAHYLSYKLDWPIFSNDSIRSEVIEDLGTIDEKIYKQRRDTRLIELLKQGASFIYDASVDREWYQLAQAIKKYGYQHFIISLDLSREVLISFYKQKGYQESLARIDNLTNDHNIFLKNYTNEVNLSITDNNFVDRLQLSYEAAQNFLNKVKK